MIGLVWTGEVIEVSRRIAQEDLGEKQIVRLAVHCEPARRTWQTGDARERILSCRMQGARNEDRAVCSLGVVLAVDVMRLLAFAGCSGVVDHRIVGDGGHRIVGDGGPDEKEREDKGCNAHGVVASCTRIFLENG